MTTDMIFDCGGAAVRVNVPSAAVLLDRVEEKMRAGQGFALATINLDHLTKLGTDPVFRDAYLRQTFVVADGNPIVWMSKLAGRRVELVPGSELVEPLAALAARLGAPIALLGATQEALDAAALQLEADHPGLEVVARIAPPFGFDPMGDLAADLLEDLRTSGARLCFLALGAPKQELLAARALDLVPGCGFASVGAGIDFIAGAQTRAPVWVRKIAMEWAWRLASNPTRLFKRYAQCAALLPGLSVQALRLRRVDR
jgi:exopolysaccharide biosynthesis WecB/TagA/CpsF family protein